tara:strand:+ start:1110 stop:1598 length:489 start_codon:yes stop_codon:yes gene_type:complete
MADTDKKQEKKEATLANSSTFTNMLIVVLGLAVMATVYFTRPAPTNPADSIVVIDGTQLALDLTEAGKTAAEVRVYIETLVAVYVKEGFIIIDNDSTLGQPAEFMAQLPDEDALYAKANQMGIVVNAQTFKDAEAEVERTREEFLRSFKAPTPQGRSLLELQ